jgi:VanZ family protein
MRCFVKYWVPVVCWLVVIFIGSSDLMSAEHTSRFVEPFLRWLNPDISPAALNTIQLGIRKLGHLAEYGVLAILLWRGIRGGMKLHATMFVLLVAVWIACAIFAAIDEFHQSFIASRTASLNDLLTDSLGAAIGLAICLAIARWDAKKLDGSTGKS